MQLGFTFDDSSLAQRDESVISWKTPKLSVQQYQSHFKSARSLLAGLNGILLDIFTVGIAVAQEQFQRQVAHCKYDDQDEFSLWRLEIKCSAKEGARFMGYCFEAIEAGNTGYEVKIKENPTNCGYGVHIAGLGSVVLHTWGKQGFSVDFRVWRDTFFFKSWRENLVRTYAPYSVWRKAYCADKIASAPNGIASVPTFAVDGREYINDGGMHSGTYSDCTALTFRPASTWTGETFNYSSICKAWDEGRIERGDQRGLLIKVRGVLCVVDGVAIFYDDHVDWDAISNSEEAWDEDLDDELDFSDGDDDLVLAEAA